MNEKRLIKNVKRWGNGGEKDKKIGFYSKKTQFFLEVSIIIPIFATYNNNVCCQKCYYTTTKVSVSLTLIRFWNDQL